MPEKFTPTQVLAAAFAISSLGGLAGLLRSNAKLSIRSVVSAILYSGLMGLCIALLWYKYFDGDGNVYFLLGVSGLAGIGGTTVIDFIVQAVKKGGLNIVITAAPDPVEPPPPSPPPPPTDSEGTNRDADNRPRPPFSGV